MEIDVVRIETQIYQSICQDFAEYCTNRLKVYEGVTDFLKVISLQDVLNNPVNLVYELYMEHCNENELSCLTDKSFTRVMVSMCGFKVVRRKYENKQVSFYALDGD